MIYTARLTPNNSHNLRLSTSNDTRTLPTNNASVSITAGSCLAAQDASQISNGTIADGGLPVQPPLKEVYHDLVVSKFHLSDLPAYTYFLDFECPRADPTLSAAESEEKHGWVDLSQFVVLLKRDNAFPPLDGRPKLSSAYFTLLETWLPATGSYQDGADAVLDAELLSDEAGEAA